VESGVKEAKIVLTTGRNEELCSVYAICRSFLFGKLPPRTNAPARIEQILSVLIKQSETHEREISKPERIMRRERTHSALLDDHFRNRRLGKKLTNVSTKGKEDKADNVTQKLVGVDDTAFIGGKTQFGKLRMNEHTANLDVELTFRGLAEFLALGWTEKLRKLKDNEQKRNPIGDKKYFFAQSDAPIVISKL